MWTDHSVCVCVVRAVTAGKCQTDICINAILQMCIQRAPCRVHCSAAEKQQPVTVRWKENLHICHIQSPPQALTSSPHLEPHFTLISILKTVRGFLSEQHGGNDTPPLPEKVSHGAVLRCSGTDPVRADLIEASLLPADP